MSKERITVSVDPDLIAAGAAAVADGRAESMSAWVNEAMAEKAAKDQRRMALAEAIAAYEAEFGVITEEEMDEQDRLDKEAAAAVRAGTLGRRRGRGVA
jgi:Arc/MetJ-type ribon-helix-helix transcriptional regulator